MKNTFPKQERLASRIRIEELFSNGEGFCIYPFRILYYFSPEETPGVHILFSVPKKKFKKAIERNRIKRLCRESYRVQKHELLEKNLNCSFSLNIGIIYTGNQADISLEIIQTVIKQILNRLIHITASKESKPECL